MRSKNTIFCQLLLLTSLITANVATANEPSVDENTKVVTLQENTPQQDKALLAELHQQLSEDLSQQLSSNIRNQVRLTLVELATAVKQVVSN